MNTKQRLPDSSDPRDIAIFLDSRLSDLEERLSRHFDERISDVLTQLKASVPAGDLARHRADHEALHKREDDARDLRRSLLRNGAWGTIAAIAALNWEGIKSIFRGIK